MRKKLEHADEARDVVEEIAVAVPEIEQCQFFDQRIASDEHAGDSVRPAIGRAQHDKSRSRIRAHPLP